MTDLEPARAPGALRTRDCLDPWKMVLVKANGDVALCCWGVSVGNMHRESLPLILEGAQAHAARARLLSGELGADCVHCPGRAWTNPSALRERVKVFLAEENERRALRGHAATLERDLDGHRRENATHSAHLAALSTHAATLERDRQGLHDHASTLQSELAALRPHAGTLERELHALRAHAATQGRELIELRAHARTLERQLSSGVTGLWRRATAPLKRLIARSARTRPRTGAVERLE